MSVKIRDAPNQALMPFAEIYCLRCGRKLTKPTSAKSRLGPLCKKKQQASEKVK